MDVMHMWKLIYQENLPDDIEPAKTLLQQYSHINSEHVEFHLQYIRSKAWSTIRTPCIGRWRFLYNMPPSDARYKLAVTRLKTVFSRDLLLDLGCGMGQAMRQLINDGVPTTRVLGTDIHPAMIDLGFDLFRDRDSSPSAGTGVFASKNTGMGSRFVIADFLNDRDPGLKMLNEKPTIVHASNFWHMFPWHQQIEIAVRLVSMLKPDTQNAMFYGRQIGSLDAAPPPLFAPGLEDDYHGHDYGSDELEFHIPRDMPPASPASPVSPRSKSPSISSMSSFDSEVAPFSDTSSLASSVSFSMPPEADDSRAFLHNLETFQLMWDIVGERTLTRWRVEMDFVSKTTSNIPGFADDAHVVHYGVHQIK